MALPGGGCTDCADTINALGRDDVMKRVMLTVAYDGTNLCMAGSCSQTVISIEEVLNRCLTELLKETGAGDRREPDGFRRTCLREYCRF